jgi:hypothetical protein
MKTALVNEEKVRVADASIDQIHQRVIANE